MVEPTRVRPVSPGALVAGPHTLLAAGVDVDGRAFDGDDLGSRSLQGLHLSDATLTSCTWTHLELRGARLFDVVLAGCAGAGLAATESTLRHVALEQCRIGALGLNGSRLRGVQITGGKLDFVNLRGAQVRDLVLRDCVIGELDLGGAQLERVALPGCRVDSLQVHDARLEHVDLRGAAFAAVHGVEHLRGATIRPAQLVDLAPAMAAHLGVHVERDDPPDPRSAEGRSHESDGLEA